MGAKQNQIKNLEAPPKGVDGMTRINTRGVTPGDCEKLFIYEPDTGALRWRHGATNRLQPGDIAGFPHSSGYWRVKINRVAFAAHRVIWAIRTGEWPVDQIDHINRNRTDNRWCNLREATQSQNIANTTARRTNALGVKGVQRHGHKFSARIYANRRSKFLGCFNTIDAAKAAYDSAQREIHGEYARSA